MANILENQSESSIVKNFEKSERVTADFGCNLHRKISFKVLSDEDEISVFRQQEYQP